MNALRDLGLDQTIAALGVLLAAVISAAAAIRSGRMAHGTARELEELKASMADRRRVSEAHATVLTSRLAALDAGAKAIQEFKDSVQVVLSSARNGMSAEDAVAKLTVARDNVLEAYSSHHSALEEDSKVFHAAKNVAIATHKLLSEALHGLAFASEIAQAERTRALELRLQMTDAQLAMHDRRSSLQTEMLERRRA